MNQPLIGGNHMNFRVWDFVTRPEPVRDDRGKETGEVKLVDYVLYGPPHLRNVQTVEARVDRVLKAVPPKSDNNIHQLAAWARRQLIEPLYVAWKKGETMPESGTPLAVLNFLRPEDVKALKTEGVVTVEKLSELHEAEVSRMRVPTLRDKVRQAKLWLEAQDTNRAAAKAAAQEAAIAEQADELKRLRDMVANLMNSDPDDEPDIDENGDRIPKRRGRPPKIKEDEAA